MEGNSLFSSRVKFFIRPAGFCLAGLVVFRSQDSEEALRRARLEGSRFGSCE